MSTGPIMQRVLRPVWLAVLLVLSLGLAWIILRETQSADYTFEVTLTTKSTGFTQVYYDIAGRGFREKQSSETMLAGPGPHKYELTIPAGHYYKLRFDPVNTDDAVVIADAHVTGPDGRVVRQFSAGDFMPANQIAHTQVQAVDTLEVQPAPGANDAYFTLKLDPALNLPWYTGGGSLPLDTALMALPIFATFVLLAIGLGYLVAYRHRPEAALVVLLMLSVLLSWLIFRQMHRAAYTFQVTLTTKSNGHVQVYYDITGKGFDEVYTSVAWLKGSRPHIYQLPLPPGHYSGLRLDPIDTDDAVVIADARIIAPDGQVVRRFAASDFTPANQIARTQVLSGGGLEVQPSPGANDVYLILKLDPALNLPWYTEGGSPFAQSLLLVPPVFALFALLYFGWRRLAPHQPVTAVSAWGRRRPQTALALTAVFTVVVSSYPVVFLGKSFVSPNVGVLLLYDSPPQLPGHTDARMDNPMHSDVGALMWEHIPLSMVGTRAVEAGEWPLWNRYNSSGTFLLGQMQFMLFNPLHLPETLAGGASWAWDVQFFLARWLFALGGGLIAWQLARNLPSAMLATFSSLFIGFFLYRLNHPAVFSICYSPWILYFWVRAAESQSLRETSGWAAGLILANWIELTSGTAKEAVVLMLGLNFTGIVMLTCAARPWAQKLREFCVLGAAGFIFLLLSMPIWLTFLDALGLSFTNYDAPQVWQVPLTETLGLFDEIFYHHDLFDTLYAPSANFLVMFGVLYFIATLGRERHGRLTLALAASAVPSLAMLYGVIPPSVIVQLPLLRNIWHIHNTFSCLLIVLFIPLAAVGYHSAWKRLGSAQGRTDAIIVLLLLTAMIVSYRPFWVPPEDTAGGTPSSFTPWSWITDRQTPPFIWQSLIVLPTAFVVLLFALRIMSRRQRITPLPGLLATLCIGAMLWRFGEQSSYVGLWKYTYRPGSRADFQAESPAIDYLQADKGDPFRVIGMGNNLYIGWSDVYGLEGIDAHDPLLSRHYFELKAYLGFVQDSGWRVYTPEKLRALRPAYDFLNIKYYVDRAGDELRLKDQLQPVASADLQIYRSNSVWPRAFFTDRLAAYESPADFVKMVLTGDGQPFAAWQNSEAAPPLPLSGNLAGRTIVPAHNYVLTYNDTSFDVTTTGPGVIVLTEAWFKDGFHVLLNGRPADYFRLNHAFKGVFVNAAGTYHVVFAYWPERFTFSLQMSAFGAVLLIAAAFLSFRYLSGRVAPVPAD